jgi:hypothetical protein
MPITGQDDNFFLTDTGGRIAKAGLSQSKRDSFANQIASAIQTLPPEPAAVAPMRPQGIEDTNINVQALADNWPDPVGQINSLDQLPQAAPQTPQLAPQAPMTMDPMAQMQQMPQAPMQMAYSITPEQIDADYINSFNKRAKAQNDLLKVEQKKFEAQEKAQLDHQSRLDQINYERSLIEQKRQQAVQDVDVKLDETRKELADAKIDPDRFYGGSTGKRLLAGIAIAFGEIGRSLSGGNTNAALSIINNAIDQDIAAQKEGVNILRDRIQTQRQARDEVFKKFGDLEAQQLAQKEMSLEMAQNQINIVASRYGTQEARARADELIGQLESQKAQARAQLYNIAASKQAAQDNAVRQMIRDANEKGEKTKEKLQKLVVPGLGVAQNEQDAKDMKAALEAKDAFNNRLQEMIALREKHQGGAFLNREDVARGKQLSKDLLLKYKDMAKLGVLSQADQAILEAIIPGDPLQYNDPISASRGEDPTLFRLKKFKADADADFAARARTRMQYIDPQIERMMAGEEGISQLRQQYNIRAPGATPQTKAAGR